MIDRSTMLSEVRSRCPSLSPWVKFCYALCYRAKVFNKVFLWDPSCLRLPYIHLFIGSMKNATWTSWCGILMMGPLLGTLYRFRLPWTIDGVAS
ncbi:hypothetical protein V2J09_021087 [Rumex salicifolius]